MNRSRFAGLAERLIQTYGATAPGEETHPTLLNGREIDASWTQAEPGRAQMFLDDEHWGKPAYYIRFAIAALDVPYSLANGAEVKRTDLGWRGVVRHVDVPTAGGGIFAKALITLVPN